jgi:glycerol kinase
LARTPSILSIDQGTTSSRAILFDESGKSQYTSQRDFPQYFPADGWVEHDPEDIWSSVHHVVQDALAHASLSPVAIGITNQRETTVIWDRATGKPIYNAIVWQDRRTADICNTLQKQGLENKVVARTGLRLDPYFSASKIAWILDHVPGARAQAEKGQLAFGTIDSFLLWRLTNGRVHATDATNASRTALFNIKTQEWDSALLEIFNVPSALLPEVRDTASDFGITDPDIIGHAIPVGALVGDQQAALIGQGCLESGMLKSTYGTGCFAMLHTGTQPIVSNHQLLTTVAYRLNAQAFYAMEGSIFMAGATVQWLKDQLGIVDSASETEALAASLSDNEGVFLVPAFTGLGPPHWNPHARGTLVGMTRDTNRAHIARAALEAVCYQSAELISAMTQDYGHNASVLRIDGGMARNNWMAQYLSDMTALEVQRPTLIETTALGAARLAGLQTGLYGSLKQSNSKSTGADYFAPTLDSENRRQRMMSWERAVKSVLHYAQRDSSHESTAATI